MNVLELFRRLSLGELSNLAIGNDGAGTIKDAAKPKVVMYTNEALKRLYSRFILKERALLLELRPHIASYKLHPVHATSSIAPENTAECYIIDSADDPFTGDVVRVLEAQDNLGRDLVLNDAGNSLSLFTPQSDIVQVPVPLCGQVISLNYQAYHAKLVDGDEEQLIDIPDLLDGALTAFIAHKIFGDINTQEATMASQKHLGNYEAICLDAEEKDLLSTSRSSAGIKFQNNGWK